MAPAHKKRATGKFAPGATAVRSTKRPPISNKPQGRVSNNKAAIGPSKASQKRKALELESDDDGHGYTETNVDANTDPEVVKPPVLREIIRAVPRLDMRKWPLPTEKVLEDVREIFKAAERPALMTIREPQQKEAQLALQKLITRLQYKLEQTRVPTVGKDNSLSFERLINKNAELGAILEPTITQNVELEKELELQKAKLVADENYLKVLQKNAKSQERVREEQTRALPRAFRTEPQGPIDDITMKPPDLRWSFKPDRAIRTVTVQLQQHLHSMESNSNTLGDVPECILRGRAAVEEVLKRGGPQLYSQVLGL